MRSFIIAEFTKMLEEQGEKAPPAHRIDVQSDGRSRDVLGNYFVIAHWPSPDGPTSPKLVQRCFRVKVEFEEIVGNNHIPLTGWEPKES